MTTTEQPTGTTTEREARRIQKDFLKGYYPDYDPKRHDAFVIKYCAEQERAIIERYMKNRNI